MRPQYTPHPSRRAQERAPQDEDASHVVTERTPLNFIFVLLVGLLAGTISGIVGTGSSIMLMPVLVYQYGPKEAVPIIAGAGPVGDFSRHLALVGRGRLAGSPGHSGPRVSARKPFAPG